MNTVYHRIDSSSGSVVSLRASGVTYNELAEVSSRGRTSLAQVIKIDGENVSLQVFAGARGFATDARVRRPTPSIAHASHLACLRDLPALGRPHPCPASCRRAHSRV